jgi:hypothetical protein
LIAGHFGFAAGVKAAERPVPLWSLMLATAWLDVVFVPLYLGGIETIEVAPDAAGSYGGGIIHANYTHSLIGAAVLSIVYGAAFGWRWGRRTGIVLGLVAFSHWILDLIVHRPDLPILPGGGGGLPDFGFGLWRNPMASAGLELAIVVVGAVLYWRAALQVTAAAGGAKRGRANLAGAMVLIFGLAVLFFDFTGMLG